MYPAPRIIGLKLYCYAFERPEGLKGIERLGYGKFYIYDHSLSEAKAQLEDFIKQHNEEYGTAIEMPKFIRRERW